MIVPARGLLFDCDGVLVDSLASVDRAWSQWASEQALVPAEVLAMIHGRRSADTVAALIPPAQQERALARIDRLEIDTATEVRALPGAAALLGSLPDGCWAVVTSATRALALARLAAAGLPVPEVLVAADMVRHGKPHPEGYLTAAQSIGVPAGDCVVVEDAPDGIAAARAAGVGAVIGIGDRAAAAEPDVALRDLSGVRHVDQALDLSAAELLAQPRAQ